MGYFKRRKARRDQIKRDEECEESYSKFMSDLIKDNDTGLGYIIVSDKEFWDLNMTYNDFILASHMIEKEAYYDINGLYEGSTLAGTSIKIYIEGSKLTEALKKEEELAPLKSFIGSRIKIKETKNN